MSCIWNTVYIIEHCISLIIYTMIWNKKNRVKAIIDKGIHGVSGLGGGGGVEAVNLFWWLGL